MDTILKEVNNLAIGQLKLTAAMDKLHKHNTNTDKTSAELVAMIKILTSCLEALEQLSKPPPHAPVCEEEERANDYRNQHQFQGDDLRVLIPHHTLGKGEFQNPKIIIGTSTDIPKSSSK